MKNIEMMKQYIRENNLTGQVRELVNGADMDSGDAIEYVYHENSSTMRVQLIFEGKPEPDIRAILKSHAFKWCPSQGTWQRQLTENGKRAARQVLDEMRMLNGGKSDD